ncbi:hypothetical protein AB0O82_10820 [Kitasatospora sp. NPDC088264]|uniref:hypothetical protein n=1 Tax=Kitasatospora sp. NPDC088264 TaxID=3155296 RepID=UPI0034383BB3
MDHSVLAWLLSQLGPTTDQADLAARYARLGTARAVAAEVLAERRSTLLADPLRLTVDGVITMDNTGNLAGLERQIAAVQTSPAPDDQTAAAGHTLSTAPLRPTRRLR